jgi:hypothetical protein
MTLRRLWWLCGWSLVAFVIYLSLAPRTIDLGRLAGVKPGHFLAYFGLMLWFSQLMPSLPRRCALAAGFALMGVSLEYLQDMVGRDFAYVDMRDNTFGVLVGWLAATTPAGRLLQWLESKRSSAR